MKCPAPTRQRANAPTDAHFQRLSQAFDDDQALTLLIEALTGESQATAYLAAQLLAALGRSPAVLGSETLRSRIADILSEALRQPNAKWVEYVAKGGASYLKAGWRRRCIRWWHCQSELKGKRL